MRDMKNISFLAALFLLSSCELLQPDTVVVTPCVGVLPIDASQDADSLTDYLSRQILEHNEWYKTNCRSA